MTEENKIPLPGEEDAKPLPPDFLKSDEWFEADVGPYRLDFQKAYEAPRYTLSWDGIPFAPLGGIHAITGQAGNGKTMTLAQFMAAILCGEYGLLRCELDPNVKRSVLYIDTEMEKLSSAKVMRRVHWLCDVDMNAPFPEDRFAVLWLKNMPSNDGVAVHRKRYDMIRLAVDAIQPDVVFVDGLRDLLSSINDEESITKILNDFGSLAEERNLNIWMALHQNPSRKNDDDEAKMRGWAGTEFGNKVSDTLVSIKSKTANGVTFTVKQQDARDKDMDDWKFEITEDAGALGVPRIITTGTNLPSKSKEQPQADDKETIRDWIETAKSQYEWPMSRVQIKSTVFGDIGGQKNKDKQQADLNVAINMHYLEESTVKSGNGSYMLQPPDEMPF